jgi:1-acyl-sn-glycerol-3-phosphate acyltransferase
MRICWNLFLRLQGWKVVGEFPYHILKAVFVMAPHTSSWDFVVGLAIRSKLKLYHFRFLGKDSLFKGPFGFFFRKMGGFPVDRSNKHNMVDQVVELFNQHDQFILALSPEGTRKKVDRLKTGFYHIAQKAHVPIILTGFDFGKKEISFSEPFYPTSNIELDFKNMLRFYVNIEGKNPEQGIHHLIIPA